MTTLPVANVRRNGALVVTTVVALMTLGALMPAAAHTELVGSIPRDGERLESPPETVALTFNEAISGKFVSLALVRGRGAEPLTLETRVDNGVVSAHVPTMPTDTVSATEPVRWTLNYRVASTDGHPISGRIRFTIEPTGGTATATSSPSPGPRASEPGRTNTAPESTTAEEANDQALSTLVIGGIAAVGTVGIMYLLARGRGRGRES